MLTLRFDGTREVAGRFSNGLAGFTPYDVETTERVMAAMADASLIEVRASDDKRAPLVLLQPLKNLANARAHIVALCAAARRGPGGNQRDAAIASERAYAADRAAQLRIILRNIRKGRQS